MRDLSPGPARAPTALLEEPRRGGLGAGRAARAAGAAAGRQGHAQHLRHHAHGKREDNLSTHRFNQELSPSPTPSQHHYSQPISTLNWDGTYIISQFIFIHTDIRESCSV